MPNARQALAGNDPASPLPLRPVVFEILLLLNERQRHGYGLMKDLATRATGRWILGPGTLYRTLRELQDGELIAPTPAPAGDNGRRRYYRLTDRGRRLAAAEARRMATLVRLARAGDLLPGSEGG